MTIFNEEQANEKARIVQLLRDKLGELEEAIDEFNTTRQDLADDVEEAIDSYNQRIQEEYQPVERAIEAYNQAVEEANYLKRTWAQEIEQHIEKLKETKKALENDTEEASGDEPEDMEFTDPGDVSLWGVLAKDKGVEALEKL